MKKSLPVDTIAGMQIPELAARLEALGHETRLTIFRILVRAGQDGLSVGGVQDRTGLAGSTLSHHLHKLISVGLVSQRREGRSLYCLAEYTAFDQALETLRAECCVDAVDEIPGPEEADRHEPRSDP